MNKCAVKYVVQNYASKIKITIFILNYYKTSYSNDNVFIYYCISNYN